MPVKAVIFDLDGTLTEPYFDFDAIREEMGLAKDAGPVWEAMAQMSSQHRLKAERILDFHERQAVQQSSLNEGVREVFEALGSAGIRIGILTRNKKSNACAVARRHGLKFDAVVGREEGPVKPDAFGLLKLCRQFGVSPAETLLVGDYLFDLLCAKAAGTVAVLLANHHKAGEFAEHADFTIDRIDEVLQIIEEKNNRREGTANG